MESKSLQSSGIPRPRKNLKTQAPPEAHRRRRAALLGIVSGLERDMGTPLVGAASEDSEYSGEAGIAIDSGTWISGVPPEIARLFDCLEDILVLHTQILSPPGTTQDAQYPVVH